MVMAISPLAGTLAPAELLVNVNQLVAAYYNDVPDSSITAQRVIFGTSGHRGSALEKTFNEAHVLAICQSICHYREQQGIDGPLYLGVDTHALSAPAFTSALEVLAANGVHTMIAANGEYTPTPAISHAILACNLRLKAGDSGFADGIIITPSHNPPEDGGIKYNPPHGGPAGSDVTRWIEAHANALLGPGAKDIKRMPYEFAMNAATTHQHDYLDAYVADLGSVINMDAIRESGIHMGVDPLGGAGVHYWRRIAEHYRLDLTVTNETVDSTFGFMSRDWDGRIRMDPASPYAMQGLIEMKNRFDIAFACDTDHDRHGIVTPGSGLLPPNHYLSTVIHYLFQHRPQWAAHASVGKTIVSSSMIDRVTARLGRKLIEVPVGFKWFVESLANGALGCVGEESAGTTFLRRNGAVWTTEKDGIVPALLAAEMSARTGRDPGEIYRELEHEFGVYSTDRIDAPATAAQRARLALFSPDQIMADEIAGEKILQKLNAAPGNNAPIGGIKVITASGWFAARPSGTENIYKIYAESTRGHEHLALLLSEAQIIVDQVLAHESD